MAQIENMQVNKDNGLFLGLDVGSTTVKAAVWDSHSDKVVYTDYRRHGANQAACPCLAAGGRRVVAAAGTCCTWPRARKPPRPKS